MKPTKKLGTRGKTNGAYVGFRIGRSPPPTRTAPCTQSYLGTKEIRSSTRRASAGIAPPPLSRAQLGELRTARAQAARVGATAGRAGVAEAAEAAEEAAEAAAEEEELLIDR